MGPGQVSSSLWLPVFSLLSSCLGPPGGTEDTEPPFPAAPVLRVDLEGQQGHPPDLALLRAASWAWLLPPRTRLCSQGSVLPPPQPPEKTKAITPSANPSLPPNTPPNSPLGISQLRKAPFPQWPERGNPE